MNQKQQLNEALVQAAKDGNFDDVRRLVEQGADVNYGEIRPFITPLLWAYFNGHKEIVKYLLSNGGEVNYDKFDEGTLLTSAAFNGDAAFIPDLLEAGAAANHPMPQGGETALHHAADTSQTAAARALIEGGADVNRRAGHGLSALNFGRFAQETPLHVAAVRSKADFILTLLDAGADKTAQNANGLTPLALAAQAGRPEDILNLLIPFLLDDKALF